MTVGERDDWRAQGAVRDRRVVGDGGDPDGIEIRYADRNQDRSHEGPGIAETHQAFEQGAESPGEQDGLHPDVAGSLLNEPAPQLVEGAGRDQRVEQHHSPKRDPIDIPNAGGGAIKIGAHPVAERHLPDPQGKQKSDNRADQHRQPGRHAQTRQQKKQQDDRDQRNQPSYEQVSSRIENLRKHGQSLPPMGRQAVSSVSIMSFSKADDSAAQPPAASRERDFLSPRRRLGESPDKRYWGSRRMYHTSTGARRHRAVHHRGFANICANGGARGTAHGC